MSLSEISQLNIVQQQEFQPAGSENKRIYFDYRRLLIKLLKPTEFVILEALNLRANPKNNGWCWPGLKTIAEDTNITSPTTIISAIKRLKELGVLEVERRKTLFYRPVKPSPELVTKLAFLTTSISDYSEIELELEEDPEVPETGIVNFQKLQAPTIPENGVNRQKLEEKTPKSGILEVQNLEPNESQRIENNFTNQNECTKECIKVTGDKNNTEKTTVLLEQDQFEPDCLKEVYLKEQTERKAGCYPYIDLEDVLKKAFRFAFHYPPDIGRLLKMAHTQTIEDYWQLIEIILSLAGKKIKGDPHNYLQQVIHNKQNQKLIEVHDGYGTNRAGWPNKGHQPGKRPERTIEETRREFQSFRLPGS